MVLQDGAIPSLKPNERILEISLIGASFLDFLPNEITNVGPR